MISQAQKCYKKYIIGHKQSSDGNKRASKYSVYFQERYILKKRMYICLRGNWIGAKSTNILLLHLQFCILSSRKSSLIPSSKAAEVLLFDIDLVGLAKVQLFKSFLFLNFLFCAFCLIKLKRIYAFAELVAYRPQTGNVQVLRWRRASSRSGSLKELLEH